MRQFLPSIVITLVALALAAWSINPPEKNIRRGKDLSGGVSLVYSVQIGPNERAEEVIPQTIDALLRRVNPDGLLEISMVQQGRDRIEMSMPLPNDNVKRLRKDFETELATLGRASLTDARIDQCMRLSGAEREAQIKVLSAGSAKRLELLTATAAAYDKAAERLAAYNAATDPTVKDQLVSEVATAQIAADAARREVLSTALSAEEIRKVAQASTKKRTIRDGKDLVAMPSVREQAEKKLLEKNPESAEEIKKILATYDIYAQARTTLDDPQDLIRQLKGAGVLTFRITVKPNTIADEVRLRQELRELGPKNAKSTDFRWFKLNQIDGWIDNLSQAKLLAESDDNAAPFFQGQGYVVDTFAGDYYMLCYDTPGARLTPAEGTWGVSNAYRGTDPVGSPAINFEMTPSGAVLLGRLTSQHVGEPMAILLDDEVYTAPTLNSAISASGLISGKFSDEEIQYVVRVLKGGSLQTKISSEPISISSFGPELGADNLQMGLKSAMISLIIVAVFMLIYYFGYGVVAVVATLANALLILGCMAVAKAPFTMPGIAGMILTFGMAVDSNVLVYERMREEFNRGVDMKNAVRLGFSKALSSIVDGNITNLIVCLALYQFGTIELKGFAVTMGLGVLTTLFAALVVSRLIFDLAVAAGWKRGSFGSSMLPIAIPSLQNWLTPTIDWLKYRHVFFTISAIYVALGMGLVFYRGSKMLDNEFIGGTQVTLQFRNDAATGEPVTLTRPAVQQRLNDAVDAMTEAGTTEFRSKLRDSEIFPVNPRDDGVTSDRFTIKTTADNARAVLDVLLTTFADVVDTRPPLAFDGSDAAQARLAPAYSIEKPVLRDNIDRENIPTVDVRTYVGGVAIVLSDIEPPQPLSTLVQRLNTVRESTAYSDTLARRRDVIVVDGTESAVRGAVILVADDSASVLDNESKWETDLRNREWALTVEALAQASTPASVHNFTGAVASTFRRDAIFALLASFLGIGVYIWIRFKTPRHSIAAVVALLHDVLAVIGLIALCEILYENPATHGFAQSIGLLPFKIDLNLVAALLTIAGYSLNDTVVVMDRIRENQGKLPFATRDIINNSVNQTFSRTIITGGTTLFSCLVLYLIGGEGMRAFAFTLFTGLIIGTYSSVAVAAPIVWSSTYDQFGGAPKGAPEPEPVPAS